MKTVNKLSMIAGLSILTTSLHAGIKKQKLSFQECPPAVQKTIANHSRGGEIDKVRKISIPETTLYLAEIEFGKDRDLELYVDSSGRLVKSSEEVGIHSLPEAVSTAARALGGKIDDIEKVTSNGKVTYEIEIDRRKAKDLDVVFSPTGELLSQSVDQD